MTTISEELGLAIRPFPPGAEGLLVKVVRLTAENYPGRDAAGILPVFVVGHEEMTPSDWRSWVRRVGTVAYGPGYTERVVDEGVDLRDLNPTAGFGREMRVEFGGDKKWRPLSNVVAIIEAVTRWPHIANAIVENFANGDPVTLREFLHFVNEQPSPVEAGGNRGLTLGDLLFRGPSTLGGW